MNISELGSTQDGKEAKEQQSKQQRACLEFPVEQIQCSLTKRVTDKSIVSDEAAIYLTAILEHVCAEVLELAGNASKDNQCNQITAKSLQLAVQGDDELHKFVKNLVDTSGNIPRIYNNLLANSKIKEENQEATGSQEL